MSSKKAKTETAADNANEMADFATKSVDQAQAAVERVGEIAHDNLQLFDAAASAFKSRAADIQLKVMEIAQTNLNAQFDFARRFWSVRDPADLLSLHQAFLRDQVQAVGKQSKELGDLSLQFAKETAKPFQDGFVKSFGEFARTFAR